jgi:hypothetical protein
MSLLPSGVVASPGNPYFASAAVNNQIFTPYSLTVNGAGPFSVGLTKGGTAIGVGTFLVSVQVSIQTLAASATATDILSLEVVSSGQTLPQIGASLDIPIGFFSTYLNANSANLYYGTITGILTSTNPNAGITMYAFRRAGTGNYSVNPYNVSYVPISPNV